MSGSIFMVVASLALTGWGIAHLFPTIVVVKGFGDISEGNKRIITMEWINAGLSLVFIGCLVAVTTFVDGASLAAKVVYSICIVVLNLLSVISLFRGFRKSHIAFKLCPFIFTGSSILIAVGGMLN